MTRREARIDRDLRIERFLKHPPERVWKALTDPKHLAAWYMPNDFQPVVGHQFQFRTEPGPGFDGILYCEVVAVEAPTKLVYRFSWGDQQNHTLVSWSLNAYDGGTHLVLEHTGFRGLRSVIVSAILQYGWWNFLRGLPDVLSTIEREEQLS